VSLFLSPLCAASILVKDNVLNSKLLTTQDWRDFKKENHADIFDLTKAQ
jgi:uncharacterized protein YfkK (UPF0435 family)